MDFKRYKYLVLSDLYWHRRQTGLKSLLSELLFGEAYKYNFWFRTAKYLHQRKLTKYTLFPLSLWLLNHYRYKLGVSIPYQTNIDSGFYIGHFGGIVINKKFVIGKNCNISQGVNLGQGNRGAILGSRLLVITSI